LEEQNLTNECIGKKLDRILICPVSKWGTDVQTNDDLTVVGVNFGCVFMFDDDSMFWSAWREDQQGDPYRLTIGDVELLSVDSLEKFDAFASNIGSQFKDATLTQVSVYQYSSSVKTEEVKDVIQVPWGMELYFELANGNPDSMLCAALDYDSHWRLGTQNQYILSVNEEFNQKQKERFSDFLGFYGEMDI